MKTLAKTLLLSIALAACAAAPAPGGPTVNAAAGETITAKQIAELPENGRLAIDEVEGASYRFDTRDGSIDFDRVSVRRADGTSVTLLDRLAASGGASLIDDELLEVSWANGAMAIAHAHKAEPMRSTCFCCITSTGSTDVCVKIGCGERCGGNNS